MTSILSAALSAVPTPTLDRGIVGSCQEEARASSEAASPERAVMRSTADGNVLSMSGTLSKVGSLLATRFGPVTSSLKTAGDHLCFAGSIMLRRVACELLDPFDSFLVHGYSFR